MQEVVVSKSEAFQLNLSALAQVCGSPRGFVSYWAVRTPGPKHKSTCQHVVTRNKILELMRTDLLYLYSVYLTEKVLTCFEPAMLTQCLPTGEASCQR